MEIRKYIPKKVTLTAGKAALKLQKNRPHLMFGAGIVCVVGGAVLASRATLKLEKTVDKTRDELEGLKENWNGTDSYQSDVAYLYGKGTLNVARLYAPAVVVGGVGIALLTKSHIDLTRRNAAVTAAYAALAKAYDDYRNRVREEVGHEKELEFYNAVMPQQRELDGNAIEVESADPNTWSAYARFFDEGSPHWTKDPEQNRLFVQCQQNYLNNLLQTRGHVFLNEAYEALGIERSRPGQVVGWYMGGTGDNYIDFGMFTAYNAKFVNGWERNILLDFNVDGIVIDKI